MVFIIFGLRLFFQKLSFCQKIPHVFEDLPKFSFCDRCSGDKDNMGVRIQIVQISAISLTKPPAQAITSDAVADLFADSKAYANPSEFTGEKHKHQPFGGE